MFTKLVLFALVPCVVLCACPTIITRSEWGARSPKRIIPLRQNPPPYIVVHHTDGPTCESLQTCKARVKNIQNYHMNQQDWDDIGYNFLIGGDGNVYEGRGWGVFGSHVPKFNARSIGISMIGNFQNVDPPQAQLDVLKQLISCAKDGNHVKTDYHLIGHRQGKPTSCPGNKLFNEISTWPQFDASVRP